MVKQYIVSADEEIKEYFNKTTQRIKEDIKKDILGIPLVSSNTAIVSVVEKEMKDFIDTTISVVDFYVEGIYNSGKITSRKKLKLEKSKPDKGKRYSFTQNDELFIDKYKSHRLTSMERELRTAVVEYLSHLIANKITSQWGFNDSSEFKALEYSKQELVDDEMEDILSIVDNCISSVYDEIFETVVREMIILFKRAQLEEYKNLGLNVVTFFSNDDSLSCPVCNSRSGKILSIDEVTTDLGIVDGNRHAFCKFSIDPVISYKNQVTSFVSREFSLHSEFSTSNEIDIFLNSEIKTKVDFEIGDLIFVNAPIEVESRINKIIKKLQIYAPSYLKLNKFEFIDNITDLEDWVVAVKKHYMDKGNNDFIAENMALKDQDNLKFEVSTFSGDDIIYVSPMSLDSQPIENLILREIFKPQLKVNEKIEEMFKERKASKYVGNGVAFYKLQFISYLAEESAYDYLLESVISYITSPNKLKSIDEKIFNYIKEELFNSIEF